MAKVLFFGKSIATAFPLVYLSEEIKMNSEEYEQYKVVLVDHIKQKDKTGHESVVIHLRHSSNTIYLLMERRPSGKKPREGGPSAGLPFIRLTDDSVSRLQIPFDQSTHYHLTRLHCTLDRGISLLELMQVYDKIAAVSQNYDLLHKQCYWFAAQVVALLLELPGVTQRQMPDYRRRGTFAGLIQVTSSTITGTAILPPAGLVAANKKKMFVVNNLGKHRQRVTSPATRHLLKALLDDGGSNLVERSDPFPTSSRQDPPPLTATRKRNKRVQQKQVIAIDQLTQRDTVVAIMGPTGAGKTSFINMATGKQGGVGHGLESCRPTIEMTRWHIPDTDRTIVFVDTPGFDDTHRTDVEILQMIASWLKRAYEKEIKLSGILYLHRISDNRVAGTPLRNLRAFQRLCGTADLEKVLLVTTMWGHGDEDIYNARMKELKQTIWNGMIERGSKVVRFDNTLDSARNILEQHVLPCGMTLRRAAVLQQELAGEEKQLGSLHATSELYATITNLVEKQEETLQKQKEESNRDAEDTTATLLTPDDEEVQSEIFKTVEQIRGA